MAPTVTRLTSFGDYYTSANFDEVTGISVLDPSLQVLFDAGNPKSYSGSGTTWYDISGNGYVATLTNTPVYSPANGGYFQFNGTNQYASTSYLQPAYQTSDSFTWNIWISTGLLNTAMTIGNRNYSSSPAYDFTKIDNNLNFEYFHSGTNVSVAPTSISTNTWYNVCIVKNTGTISHYVNGVFNNSTSASQSSSNFRQAFWIGGDPGAGEYGNASISVISIYNRALSPSEIINNYNAVAPRFGLSAITTSTGSPLRVTTTTVFFNQLDEVTGTENTASIVTNGLQLNLDASLSYPGTGNKWYDLSGNNSTATLFSNPSGFPGLSLDTRYKGSIYFPATTSSYVQFYAPNMGNTATVEMWANLGPNYAAGMMMGWAGYDVWCSGGNIGFNTNNGDQYGISSTQVQNLQLVNNWRHYVFVMNSATSVTTTNAIYINGVSQQLSASSVNPEVPGTRNFNGGNGAIGTYLANTAGFNENMYNSVFRVYNRQLTQTEINQNYNALAPRFKLPPIGSGFVGLRETTSAVIPGGIFDEVSGIVNSNALVINLDATNQYSYNGTGTVWHNLATGGIDTRAIGGVGWSNTYSGAFVFDGTTGYFDQVYAGSQGSLGTVVTIEMWANISTFSGGMITGFAGYDLWTNGGGLGYNTFASDQYGLTSAQVTSLGLQGNWKHYVLVWNSGTYLTNQIWINGINQSLSQIAGTVATGNCVFGNPPYLQISGHYSGGTGYLNAMSVGLFRVYNRQLSPAEIQDNFSSKRATYGV